MKRHLILACAATAALLGAGAAQAHGVQWSIGVSLPPVATVIGSAPGYYGAPVYEAAPIRYVPPVVYREPPVVYEAPPVIWRAPRPFFAPAPVFFERGRDVRWVPPGHRFDWRDSRWHDRDGHRRHHD